MARNVRRYINPANAITASRYLTLPPFFYWMSTGETQLAWTMVLLSAFLDLADGPAARYFDCASGFGELFDGLTDALCYGSYIAGCAYFGHVPIVPVVGFLGLGAINAAMRAAYTRRIGRTTNFRSWAMERVVAYTAAFAGLAVVRFEGYFYAWTIVFLMAIVVAWDAKRMLFDPLPSPEPEPGVIGAEGQVAS